MTEADRRPLDTFRGFVVRFPARPPEHLPMQPTWICANCAEEWPCGPAREQLRADTGGGTALATLMWNYLEDFARDAGEGPLSGAFLRFIAWTR